MPKHVVTRNVNFSFNFKGITLAIKIVEKNALFWKKGDNGGGINESV